MKYYPILYSRTETQDYRWLFEPHNLPENELDKLFNRVIANRRLYIDSDALLFSHSDQSSFIIKVGITSYEDQMSRTISAMQGIQVEKQYLRHIWFSMPYILKNSDKILDIWSTLDFEDMDNKYALPPQERTLNLNQIPPFEIHKSTQSFIDTGSIPFNATGLEQLAQIISNPQIPLFTFGFGFNQEMFDIFPNIDAAISVHPNINLQRKKPEQEETLDDETNQDPRNILEALSQLIRNIRF